MYIKVQVAKKCIDMRVRVYFNLHKKVFSVLDKKTGRVSFYAKILFMKDVKYIVKESGRKRVLRDKVKNVHAYIEGDILNESPIDIDLPLKIRYNPYEHESFIVLSDSTNTPIYNSTYCSLSIENNRPIVRGI